MPVRMVWALLGGLAVLSLAAIAFSMRDGSVLSFNDGFAHMKIARFVWDSRQPGSAQLGGTWLPLPHIAMLPFVWSDFAFRTGLAGTIPSALAFVAAGVAIFALALEVSKSYTGASVALLAFASNPNVLYMQASPMTEMLFLALISGATYALVRWASEPHEQRYLALAGLMAMLCTLTRYEGWGLAIGGMVLVAYIAWRRTSGPRTAWAHAFVFGMLGCYGILLWLIWSGIIFGNPFYFRSGEFSAKEINDALIASLHMTQLPAGGSVVHSVLDVFRAVNWNAGSLFTGVALFGAGLWLLRERMSVRQVAFLLILAPAGALAASFFGGDTFVLLPDRDDRLHNIRYGIVAIPALAVLAGYAASRHRLLAVVVPSIVLLQAVWLVAGNDVVTYLDATRGIGGGAFEPISASARGRTSYELSQPVNGWFERNYDHGLILIDSSSNNHVFFFDLPTEAFLQEGVYGEWKAAVDTPAEYVDWIYMQRGGTGTLRDRVFEAMDGNPQLRNFVPLLESNGFAIYLRADRYPAWAATHELATTSAMGR